MRFDYRSRGVDWCFQEMIALVTGGTRGIGLATVKALETAGYTVAVVSRSFSAYEFDLYIQADLSKRHERFRLIDTVKDRLGGLDVLVNNAGFQHEAPALEYEPLKWDYQIELMLSAPFDLSQQAAKHMLNHGGGRIINMASVAGITGTRGVVAYSVAKAGLIELTKCLSNEWLPHGITVNAIAPGFIETEMQTLKGEHKQAMLGRIPAGRLGTSEEVAAAVLWLCSDVTRYISGICLPVDGGWLAR